MFYYIMTLLYSRAETIKIISRPYYFGNERNVPVLLRHIIIFFDFFRYIL